MTVTYPTFLTGHEPSAAEFGVLLGIPAIKTSDQTIANNTLTNDTQLSIAVEANATYMFDGLLVFTCGSATPDIMLAFSIPAGASIAWYGAGAATNLASQVGSLAAYAPISNGAANYGTNDSASFPTGNIVRGSLITSSTPGTLQLQWAQVTTTGGSPITMKTGSFLFGRRIA